MTATIQWLNGRTDQPSCEIIRRLDDTGLANIFNPSLLVDGSTTFVAFRAASDGRQAFDAYLLTIGADSVDLLNLTDVAGEHGVAVVADPKLVALRGEVWVTFNTGWSDASNDLYLWRLSSAHQGAPQRCHFSDRAPIEKNWGFIDDGDRLLALYSFEPCVVLAATWPSAEGADSIEFSALLGRPGSTPARRGLSRARTIGTQPVAADGHHRLIVHEKFQLGRRRGYVGRAATLDLTTVTARTDISARRLAHSPRALLGSTPRHNPHLFSCTYFSGMTSSDDSVRLSYGINDVGFSFATIKWSDLW